MAPSLMITELMSLKAIHVSDGRLISKSESEKSRDSNPWMILDTLQVILYRVAHKVILKHS
jgi:hypothetical protein